jgi:quercetin dioxygenase-like cupin family protein
MRPESEAATKICGGEHQQITASCWRSDDVDDCVVHRANAGTARSVEGKSDFVSAHQADFHDRGNGVSMAAIWGDADKGAHAAFTKFVPGFDAGVHTHTNDAWIVVVKGAYLYKDEAGDKRVGPGSFLRVPGGSKHWSGGDSKEGALFYEESSGKFDSIPAK